MTIHVFFMFPETAGKKLEEVQDIFEDPNGIKHIGIPAWKTRMGSQYRRSSMWERGTDLESGSDVEKREHGSESAELVEDTTKLSR